MSDRIEDMGAQGFNYITGPYAINATSIYFISQTIISGQDRSLLLHQAPSSDHTSVKAKKDSDTKLFALSSELKNVSRKVWDFDSYTRGNEMRVVQQDGYIKWVLYGDRLSVKLNQIFKDSKVVVLNDSRYMQSIVSSVSSALRAVLTETYLYSRILPGIQIYTPQVLLEGVDVWLSLNAPFPAADPLVMYNGYALDIPLYFPVNIVGFYRPKLLKQISRLFITHHGAPDISETIYHQISGNIKTQSDELHAFVYISWNFRRVIQNIKSPFQANGAQKRSFATREI